MVDYKLASNQEIYNIFNKAYTEDRSSFDDPKPLYNYFKVYFQLYKEGSVTMEEIFDKYEEISERFEEVIDGYSKQLDIIIKRGIWTSS